MPDFQLFPLPFWLVVLAILFFLIKSWLQPETSLRLPMIMVLLTTAVWYIGDVLYNDYSEYQIEIDPSSLNLAWWETLGFVCAFGILAPVIHRSFNRKYLGRPSNLLSLAHHGGLKSKKFQDQLDIICRSLLFVWVALMIVALFRVKFDFIGLFMPYLGERAAPWGRGRLGGGYDSILAAAGYLQITLTAAFGLMVALSCRASTFMLASIVSFLTLPTYIFDRTRNTMLATILPGFLAWVFLRIRANLFVKAIILGAGFFIIQSWLKFVIENRTDTSIASAFQHGGTRDEDDPEEGKHRGLNMFEELGFINSFLTDGTYHQNWGKDYFAEIVNPIPRSLWSGKPSIGLDYAIARGQGEDPDMPNSAGGVAATISTGMIGQGVTNFGRFFGPLFAALLMSFWAALLARQDILATETGRLFICAIGLILTFNMGRDITLLVLYPFFFGYVMILLTERRNASKESQVDEAEKAGVIPFKHMANKVGRIARK